MFVDDIFKISVPRRDPGLVPGGEYGGVGMSSRNDSDGGPGCCCK